jgi:hypothetical protein
VRPYSDTIQEGKNLQNGVSNSKKTQNENSEKCISLEKKNCIKEKFATQCLLQSMPYSYLIRMKHDQTLRSAAIKKVLAYYEKYIKSSVDCRPVYDLETKKLHFYSRFYTSDEEDQGDHLVNVEQDIVSAISIEEV